MGRVVQKLANGITITHEVRGRMARDSEGRVYEEEQRTNGPMYVVGLDPVGPSLNCAGRTPAKTATRLGFSGELSASDISAGAVAWRGEGFAWMGRCPIRQKNPTRRQQRSDLGQKTLSGLVTTGTRTSTVVPIGELGNDRAVTIVHDV